MRPSQILTALDGTLVAIMACNVTIIIVIVAKPGENSFSWDHNKPAVEHIIYKNTSES